MYSVIIPTMWRGAEFERMLPLLDSSNNVSEIIIIDNQPSNCPNWMNRDWNKVKLFAFQKNIFVNPAWNLGVDKAENDEICIMNDDILFDVAVFDWLSDKTLQGPTFAGYCLRSFSDYDNNRHDIIPSLAANPEIRQNSRVPYRFGCLMFLQKTTWVPIPNEIKIYFGDCWIVRTHQIQGILPYCIDGFAFATRDMSTSCKFAHVNDHEFLIWRDQIFPKIGNELLPDLVSHHDHEQHKEMKMKELVKEIYLRV